MSCHSMNHGIMGIPKSFCALLQSPCFSKCNQYPDSNTLILLGFKPYINGNMQYVLSYFWLLFYQHNICEIHLCLYAWQKHHRLSLFLYLWPL